ncbi:hypothetical protein VHEMI00722 [[Torrubiella] hemipterigena]|uniref:Mif2/CENP-C cupin domain-containing protein n=1 Tax=[Torrubiella] hemipterigena TaxID=1531966 RepID=A0A0A1SR59_9HYPO|nr:hypothetical protein VHEMI00722 [[Torrubiella] hemipterigena]
MAARPTRRGDTASPKMFHELGVKGRKTGVVLEDNGVRDSLGLQPLDGIFSSPQNPAPPPPAPKAPTNASTARLQQQAPAPPTPDEYGSEAMDIPSSAGPGPQTVLRTRLSQQLQLPQSRSPQKPLLKSPPKHNPYVGPRSSSPAVSGSASKVSNANVRRQLFEKSSAQSNAGPRPGLATTTRTIDQPSEATSPMGHNLTISDMAEDAMALVDTMRTDPQEAPSEQWPAGRAKSSPVSAIMKGKQKVAPSPLSRISSYPPQFGDDDLPDFGGSPELPLPSRESEKDNRNSSTTSASRYSTSTIKRPALQDVPEDTEIATYRPAEKKARSIEPSVPPKRGRGRPPSNPNAVKRGRGRPRKGTSVSRDKREESTFVEVQRGPPLPRSRGLVSFRSDSRNGQQMRSQNRPAHRGTEQPGLLSHDAFDTEDMFNPRPRDNRGSPRESRHSRHHEEIEEELEDWEREEGTFTADVIVWDKQFDMDSESFDGIVQERAEPIAVSVRALKTQPAKGGTFGYATALRMPFMSAGVVDLPPGGVKKPKDSKNMHLVFFIHRGKALVTVNETSFRISAGGMWFVPRRELLFVFPEELC